MIHGLQEALRILISEQDLIGSTRRSGFEFAIDLIKKRIDELDKEHSKDHGQGDRGMKVAIGSIVVVSSAPDATRWEVLGIKGTALTVRESGTDYRPQVIDKCQVYAKDTPWPKAI